MAEISFKPPSDAKIVSDSQGFKPPDGATVVDSDSPDKYSDIKKAYGKSHFAPALVGAGTELAKGAGALTELFAPETGKKIISGAEKIQEKSKEISPVGTTVGQLGSYVAPYSLASKGISALRGALGLGKATSMGGRAMEAAGAGGTVGAVTTPTEEGRGTSAAIGAALGGTGTLVGESLVKGYNVVKNNLIKAYNNDIKKMSEALKDYASKKTGEEVRVAKKILDDLADQRKQQERIQLQLSEQEKKARQRAEGKQTVLPEISVKQTVADKAKQASSQALANAKSAGIKVDQAQQLANEASQQVTAAEQAVNKLESDLISRPQLSKEKFGNQLQQTVSKLVKDYSNARTTQSGLGSVIETSKDIIPTKTVIDAITKGLVGVRNPPLQRTLTELKSLAKTGDDNQLSLKSAQSLKTYIDARLSAIEGSELAVDSATKTILRDIKSKLVKSMTDKSDAYRVALGKWSTLSRPLDIVERNGALSKVPTKDPLSQAYHMAEAEVVGNIISKARAGNPVFTRLLQENPELKNSARLYFTKELFGQEAVPTIASLNTFLKTNEGPLRQLGLFNEFKDIRSSQKAAQFAVDQAKGIEKVAAKEVKEAKSLESTAKSEAARLSGRAGQAETRLSQALKTVEPIEDIAKKAAARAKPAVTKTEQKLGNITKEQKDVGKTLNDYEKLNILLRDEKDPKQIANLYNDLTERLRNEGKITPNQYQQMIGETNNILRNVKDSEEAKQKIYQFVGRTLGYGALGGAGVYGVKQFGE